MFHNKWGHTLNGRQDATDIPARSLKKKLVMVLYQAVGLNLQPNAVMGFNQDIQNRLIIKEPVKDPLTRGRPGNTSLPVY
ncbi:MAG: hypothetical protein OEZ05_13580 [Nitrospirota bacterium]|nr:hypothetical protein [Nitrospirota bacterium]